MQCLFLRGLDSEFGTLLVGDAEENLRPATGVVPNTDSGEPGSSTVGFRLSLACCSSSSGTWKVSLPEGLLTKLSPRCLKQLNLTPV